MFFDSIQMYLWKKSYFWRENGRGRHRGAKAGLGPQDPTKKLAQRVELLGQPLTRKLVFKNFGHAPPL